MRLSDTLPRERRRFDGLIVASVLFVAAGVTIGNSQYTFGLFVGPIEETFGWQRTAINASISFMAIGSIASPFIGRAMDRYGAKVIMAACLFSAGTSFVLRPFMTELWHWYALSFMQFIGFTGAASLPAGRLIGLWYRKSPGRMLGATMMGNNFGGIVLPIVVGFALTHATWREAYVVVGVLTLAIGVLALMLVREPPIELHHGTDSPETGKARKTPSPIPGMPLSQAVRTFSFWGVSAGVTASAFTAAAVVPNIGAHLADSGFSSGLIPLSLSVLAAAGMCAKPLFGFLAERLTARRAFMTSLTGQMTFVALMALFHHPAGLWLSLVLFGLSMGAHSALVPLLVQQSFGVRHFGSVAGMVNLFTVVPFAGGPILAGAAFDLTSSYAPAFILFAGMYGLGILALTRVNQLKELEADGLRFKAG
ncbi:MAG: MFS transporter [SAR202 cluster bacterium]|nr:MFS transporter [SAR202 cluster bacterium]